MKKRLGFTLIELTTAALISSFIAVAMATIYSTASNHIFQNYRGNKVKTDAALGMRAIRNAMAQATRIDEPAFNSTGERLSIAANVDQLTGHSPLSPSDAATWHLFCTVTEPDGNIKLYYQFGAYPACNVLSAGAVPPICPPNPAINEVCGAGILLAQYLDTDQVFSRRPADVSGSKSLVRVTLHSQWFAAIRGFGSNQRDIDYMLDTVFSANNPSK